jgi:hypothetical protein
MSLPVQVTASKVLPRPYAKHGPHLSGCSGKDNELFDTTKLLGNPISWFSQKQTTPSKRAYVSANVMPKPSAMRQQDYLDECLHAAEQYGASSGSVTSQIGHSHTSGESWGLWNCLPFCLAR